LSLICRRAVVLPVGAVAGLLWNLLQDPVFASDVLASSVNPDLKRRERG
jgi:hypothetical protein